MPLIQTSPLLVAQALGSVDWLYQFTNNITTLTTENGDALSQFGMILLTFIATMILIGIAVRMTSWSVHFGGGARPVTLDELRTFLFRLLFCLVLEHYWTTNLPGTSFGFNRMFSYVAQALVSAFDQKALDALVDCIKNAATRTPIPSTYMLQEMAWYIIVQLFLGVVSGVLFLINCSSFIFYGVAALFGPIFIPLYLTDMFRGKFLHFVDVLLSFAMIRAVASAFVFVWAGFLNGFIDQTFNHNYSIANWEANIVPCSMVFVAFILNMVYVPAMTQILFGGGAGAAGRIGELAERIGMVVAAR